MVRLRKVWTMYGLVDHAKIHETLFYLSITHFTQIGCLIECIDEVVFY